MLVSSLRMHLAACRSDVRRLMWKERMCHLKWASALGKVTGVDR